jgi:hypothetical protein
MVVYRKHRLLPFPRFAHILFGETLEEILSSPEYLGLPHKPEEAIDTVNATAMCLYGPLGIPILIFSGKKYNCTIGAHEAFHAITQTMQGAGGFETPLCKETHEIWAYSLELLLKSVESTKDMWDVRKVDTHQLEFEI